MGLTPSQARDEDNKALPAVVGMPPCVGCLQARHGLLAAAATLPGGQGVKVATDLALLVRWHRPLAHPTAQDETPFATAIREAELLGVIAQGALSSPLGAALLADDSERLTIVCRQLLPEATETARFGGDLTAVVAGMPSVHVAELLDSTADREISGTASVWRFSTDSVRLTLYASRTANELSPELTVIVDGLLPQPLSYLIADSARRQTRATSSQAADRLGRDALRGDDGLPATADRAACRGSFSGQTTAGIYAIARVCSAPSSSSQTLLNQPRQDYYGSFAASDGRSATQTDLVRRF
ncbi:helicase-associated domain-containing protein [Streptomyces cinereoruber]|uniref:helicase-associated domain-containing protein n=1 Tax=Streptomyces cinereoruber TaxID=67260 RepID=UPI003633939E